MQIYNETNKTKSGEQRVTRSIGALLVGMNQNLNALVNERITVYIERSRGDNHYLANKILLKDFISGSIFNRSKVYTDDAREYTQALCDLTNGGSIPLKSSESIKVELTDLKPSVTYVLNGIEYPQQANRLVMFERKQILDGELEKTLSTSGYDVAIINNKSIVNSLEFSFANNVKSKYTKLELEAIAQDSQYYVGFDKSEAYLLNTSGALVLPLAMVNFLEFDKNSGAIEVTLVKLK